MNNIVRTWEEEENLAGEIELTDAELVGVYGAGGEEEEEEPKKEEKGFEDGDDKSLAKPCIELFIEKAIININCEEERHKGDD